jgi:DNA-binding MarR family transcriptional regulator
MLLFGGFRALADAAQAELAERGHPDIRPVHDFAIRAIAAGADGASDLGRALGVSKQAAAKTIAVLEGRGYVAREVDPRDRRRRKVIVTPRGLALMATAEEIFDELRHGWAARIGAKELTRLEASLAEVGDRSPSRFDALGWFKESGD